MELRAAFSAARAPTRTHGQHPSARSALSARSTPQKEPCLSQHAGAWCRMPCFSGWQNRLRNSCAICVSSHLRFNKAVAAQSALDELHYVPVAGSFCLQLPHPNSHCRRTHLQPPLCHTHRKCPTGKAGTKPGAGSCDECNPGYYTNRDGQSSCTPCAMGFFSSSKGQQQCEPCPRGSFTEKPGAKGCKKCPIGFYSSMPGSSKCQSCPAGSFTNSTGATKCQRCPPGTYSTRNAADSSITCVDCPPGSFSYMYGSTECMLCPAGQYTPAGKSQACLDCPLGTYSTTDGSSRCLPCKAGFTTSSLGTDSSSGCNIKIVLNGAPAPVGSS
jgi:hypothetical protein